MQKLFAMTDIRELDAALLSRVDKQAWFHRYPRGWPFALFIIASVSTLASVIAIERADRQKREVELDRNVTEIASGVQRRASENMALLRAGAALFGSRETVTAKDFQAFSSGLYAQGDLHGARGVGWARMMRSTDVARFELGVRKNIDRNFLIYPRPAFSQRYSTPVLYPTQPDARSRAAVGFDMYSDPVRRSAMDQALRLRQPIATGTVQLVQDRGMPLVPGFLIYMPVFRGDGTQQAPTGFVYSPFRATEFLNSAAELFRNRDVDIGIYDQAREPARLLAQRLTPGDTGASLDRTITVAGREWVLHVSTKRPQFLTPLSRLTLLFGTVIALLITYTARLITRRSVEDRQVLEWLTRQQAIRTSLTRELNHRVKNTLANVLSIVSLTRRRTPDIDTFTESLTARLRALSATHDLLSQSDWTDAPIGEIVRSELAPYMAANEGQVVLQGPEISLAPNDALSLGLAIHELATNAAKYGALSTPGGQISLTWAPVSPKLVELHWRESGGPLVEPPRRRGFGRELIEKIVAHELRSTVELSFLPEGVECRFQVPVRQISDFNLRAHPRQG